MVKYIIKRLLLAILILFGVSIILYTLVRVMPVNAVEQKYIAAKAQNGTFDEEELRQLIIDNNLEDIGKAQNLGYSALWNKVFRDGEKEPLDESDQNKLRDRLLADWEISKTKLNDEYSKFAFTEVWQAFYLYEGHVDAITEYDEEGQLINKVDDDGDYVTNLHIYKDGKYIKDSANTSSYARQIVSASNNETLIAQYKANFGCTDEEAVELIKKDTAINTVFDTHNSKQFSKATVAIRSVVAGYCNWIAKFMSGDMGISFKYNSPVEEVILDNIGISFMVSLISLILELLIAIPLGIQSAYHQYGKLDYITTILTMIGISFPSFFFGSLLIRWFAVGLGWFPVGGFDETNLLTMTESLVLPIAVLTILSIGSMMRYTRTNTLEVLNADYIRTARAKGASESSVIYKHVFRNTLIPLVTTLAGILPGLFGGAMITETVFDLPGIGTIAYQALREGDVPFIMAYNMFLAVLTVLGVLLTDLMYAVVDPRVKLGE